MMINKLFFLICSLITLCNLASAQEHEVIEHRESSHHRHMVSVSLAHAHIKQGVESGTKDWLAIPAFMLDYNYLVSEKWAVGLHSDFILESFEIDRFDADGTEDIHLEREYPILLVGAVSYKPVHYLAVVVGGGVEFEEREDFGVFRLGLEPNIKISKNWEMVFNLTYDVKINGYDTWNLGVGIARLF